MTMVAFPDDDADRRGDPAARRHEANRRALARLLNVEPAWTAVRRAREALGMPDRTLLHAGPPLCEPTRPPAPLLSSAVLCCLYEGWAQDVAQAERLVRSGIVHLAPAQDYGAVAPLAALISPATMLVQVSDLAPRGGARRAWSLLGSGAGPQLRFGSRDPAILPRLAWRDGVLAEQLARVLRDAPVPLLPLAAAGLAGGDDLHASTAAANRALCEVLRPRLLPDDGAARHADAVAAMLGQTPLFFLTLWMAACHLMLDAAANDGSDADASLVVALAGNGEQAGIRLAGRPAQWHTAWATAPQGPRLDPAVATAVASPVIGDSGVIDALGCGGQALSHAPAIAQVLEPWLPPQWEQRAASLLAGHHLGLGAHGMPVALDCAAVAPGREPLTAIAMLDAAGERGLLGRGVYIPPAGLFASALAARDAATFLP
jgi:hypothetical protein